MPLSPSIPPATPALAPSHDEIAQCAREIWIASGQPEDRNDEIWLDAEHRLIAAKRAPLGAAAISPSPTRQHTKKRPPAGANVPRPAARTRA